MVGYLVFLTISAGLYAIFGLGLNLQWGFTGLINFGHVAFMTVGAYTTVLLTLLGMPIIVAVLIGAILASLLGLLIGTSTLRLREDYLAIVTIGISELLRSIVNNEKIIWNPSQKQWVEGTFGVQRFPLPLEKFDPNILGKLIMIAILTAIAIFAVYKLYRGLIKLWRKGNKLSSIIWSILSGIVLLLVYICGVIALYDYNYKAGLMLLVLVTLTAVYTGLEILVNSPWGRVLKAIREDEEIPRALGKNVFWYKLQSFMLGGGIAGIAGSFYAWQLTTVYPNNFEPLLTFNAWTIVVLGGAGSNPGTILGAVIFWSYDSLTRFILPQLGLLDNEKLGAFRIMVIGLILMVLMIWRPQGILGNKDELTLGK